MLIQKHADLLIRPSALRRSSLTGQRKRPQQLRPLLLVEETKNLAKGLSDSICATGDDYLPDPSDCNKFFHCSNGQAYSMTCAPGKIKRIISIILTQGTSFHADTRRCDYTDSSKC